MEPDDVMEDIAPDGPFEEDDGMDMDDGYTGDDDDTTLHDLKTRAKRKEPPGVTFYGRNVFSHIEREKNMRELKEDHTANTDVFNVFRAKGLLRHTLVQPDEAQEFELHPVLAHMIRAHQLAAFDNPTHHEETLKMLIQYVRDGAPPHVMGQLWCDRVPDTAIRARFPLYETIRVIVHLGNPYGDILLGVAHESSLKVINAIKPSVTDMINRAQLLVWLVAHTACANLCAMGVRVTKRAYDQSSRTVPLFQRYLMQRAGNPVEGNNVAMFHSFARAYLEGKAPMPILCDDKDPEPDDTDIFVARDPLRTRALGDVDGSWWLTRDLACPQPSALGQALLDRLKETGTFQTDGLLGSWTLLMPVVDESVW